MVMVTNPMMTLMTLMTQIILLGDMSKVTLTQARPLRRRHPRRHHHQFTALNIIISTPDDCHGGRRWQ
jgi:hypothetical protein